MRRDGDDLMLVRLGASKDSDGRAFLEKHHLAAGDRLERLVARALLKPRLTMSYEAASVGGRKRSGNTAAELTESAAGARKLLAQLAGILPPDCWGVVFDVCALGKGLQVVETERRWPRRSAKLVLRIGLDQLAQLWGLAPYSAGDQGRAARSWMQQRLPLIGEDQEDEGEP